MLLKLAVLITVGVVLYGVVRLQTYYFSREDVIARRAAKAKLPKWLNSLETLTWLLFYALIGYCLIQIIVYLNSIINPSTHVSSLALTPLVIAVLPIAMFASNVIFWAIPYTRKIEDENSLGVPGGSFKEANLGLLKLALIIEPVCLTFIIWGLLNP